METLMPYADVIHCILQELCDRYTSATQTETETEILCDDAHGQYQLIRVGWRGETRICTVVLCLRVKQGRLWIEQDWTQEGIANVLQQSGVPASDIVLAFQPPFLRDDADKAA